MAVNGGSGEWRGWHEARPHRGPWLGSGRKPKAEHGDGNTNGGMGRGRKPRAFNRRTVDLEVGVVHSYLACRISIERCSVLVEIRLDRAEQVMDRQCVTTRTVMVQKKNCGCGVRGG